MALVLILIATALAAGSGVPGLFLSRRSARGQWIAAIAVGLAAGLGLAGAGLGLMAPGSAGGSGDGREFAMPSWVMGGDPTRHAGFNAAASRAVEQSSTLRLSSSLSLRAEGRPERANSRVEAVGVALDPLSAFFLVPIFLMGGLGAIYGLGYWAQARHPGNGRKLHLFWGLLVAGMALLVISRNGLAFLLGWEVMALAAFFLVSAEDCRAECRRAGWVYLIATHIGTLSLFALFALWRLATGSFALHPVAADAVGLGMMNGMFVLASIGFGVKAGIMPLHFWLPPAHAAAPSHVSAIMSGVVIKMGIYGLLRFLSLLPDPPIIWGGTILVLGAASGLLGVVFAIAQHDLKRLLAYHSVENIGIILMGLGLAMLGRSMHRPEWVVLGMAGCLLHVWNHALFKALLFLGAGSVVHGAHTRAIDRLGGLAKAMPWTAALFLVGAVAICGLPPLNGFVSELLIYLGLFHTVVARTGGGGGGTGGGSAAIIAAPVLAMIGALAVACFVKVYGAVFLGHPRTQAPMHAHEAPLSMRGPMVALAACCVLIGLAPVLVSPVLDSVIAAWTPGIRPSLASVVPLMRIGAMSVGLVAAVALLALLRARLVPASSRAGTWDCGYARPTPRMQYTASSFAQSIVFLFRWVLRPRVHRPSVQQSFPRPTAMASHVDDAVLDGLLLPAGRAVERWFGWFHRFQQGMTQHYVLYIVITVILMLSTLIPFHEYLARLFAR